jgi:peptidoglycan/xylan/chitin deacetylase (PgdA/CDA1 family)
MVAEGHELGNHLTEDQPSIALDNQDFEHELIKAGDVLSQFSSVEWMRPGSGWYNEEMLTTVENYGYRMALGSVYPYDPQIGLAWYSAKYVLWKVKPGAVIVLHDFEQRGQRTIKALEIILPELEKRGYQVVSLSELVSLNGNSE